MEKEKFNKKNLIIKLGTIFLLVIIFSFLAFCQNKTILFFFYGQGCPHCAQMKPFLENLESKYPNLEVREFEVYFNQTNRELFEKVAEAYNTEIQGVPTVFIDKSVIVGYSKEIGERLEEKIQSCLEKGCISPEEILNKNSSDIELEMGDFSSYENSNSGLVVFIVMVTLLVILLFAIVLIKKKGRKK